MEIIATIEGFTITKVRKNRIFWNNDNWSSSKNKISIPISDRSLNLGDGIFETILIFNGEPKLLQQHLSRWKHSASILNMASPPTQEWLQPLIKEAIKRCKLESGNGILRLNWSRGESLGRGIDVPHDEFSSLNHHFWLEISSGNPTFKPISTIISRYEKRNAESRVSKCKTFGYSQSIQARKEAVLAGFDDALLLSTTGEICCSTTANLLVNRNGEWITPPLTSGCLPGIMREQGLKAGIIKEASIKPDPQKNDQWLLINSLSCKPIKSLNNKTLKEFLSPQDLWLSLIGQKIDMALNE